MEEPRAGALKVGFIAAGAANGKLSWATVANLSGTAVSLLGWTIHGEGKNALRLTGMLEPGDAKRIECELKLGGSGEVQLKNGAGELIDVIKYEAGDGEGCAVHGVGGLRVVCAMVNAVGDEFENEFVVLANLSGSEVTLGGHRLSDGKHEPLALSGTLGPGEALRVTKMYDQGSGVGVTLNNRSGVVRLLADDAVVDEVKYSDNREHRIEEGVPVPFNVDWTVQNVLKVPATVVSRALNLAPAAKKNPLYLTPLRYVLPAVAIALALCKICKAYKRRARAA